MDKPLKTKTHNKKQIAFQVAEILAALRNSSSISVEGDESLVFERKDLLDCQSASVKLGGFFQFHFVNGICCTLKLTNLQYFIGLENESI